MWPPSDGSLFQTSCPIAELYRTVGRHPIKWGLFLIDLRVTKCDIQLRRDIVHPDEFVAVWTYKRDGGAFVLQKRGTDPEVYAAWKRQCKEMLTPGVALDSYLKLDREGQPIVVNPAAVVPPAPGEEVSEVVVDPRRDNWPRELDGGASTVDGRPSVDELRGLLDYDAGTGKLVWKVGRGRVARGSEVEVSPREGRALPEMRIGGKLYPIIDVVWCLVTGRWPIRRIRGNDNREGEYVRYVNGVVQDLRAVNLCRDAPVEERHIYGDNIQVLACYPWGRTETLPDFLL